MNQTMKTCQMCSREYIGDDAEMCGAECKQAAALFAENLARAFTVPTTERPGQIFFYDASFGTLVDRWTILLLQRLKSKDIELQKEIDFHMHRIRRCLETKIADRQLAPHERKILQALGRKLLAVNTKGWHLRSLAKNQRIDHNLRADAALQVIELSDDRQNQIRQLDLLVVGRTHAWKTY